MRLEPLTFAALRELAHRPAPSQRALSGNLGVSVGKTHYLLRALIEKGLVKMENVRRSERRAAYLYVLTPQGIAEKARLSRLFLQRKIEEYERIRGEVEGLARELEGEQTAG